MKRSALVVIALVSTAALLVPTMASSHFESDGRDHLNGTALVLEPADGPNGKYAVLNEDDEIELLLTESNPNLEGDGINPDTVTPIKQVFTIRNTGEESATLTNGDSVRVWITDDADDVHFFHGDDVGNSIEGSNNSVVLNESESIAVGILVDTRDPDHDVEEATTFRVHAVMSDRTPNKNQPRVENPTTTELAQETIQETLTESVSTTSTGTPTPTEDPQESADLSMADRTETGAINADQTTAQQSANGTTDAPGRKSKIAKSAYGTTVHPVGYPIGALLLMAGILGGVRAWRKRE